MRTLLSNLLLAWVWASLTARYSLANLLIGFLLGYAVLWAATPKSMRSPYFGKLMVFIRFSAFYVRELLLATLRVARDVVTPTYHMRPVVIRLPLDVTSVGEISLLANLISLTPGSLVLDITADRSTLYVHSMFGGEDVEALRRYFKDSLERRVLELMR